MSALPTENSASVPSILAGVLPSRSARPAARLPPPVTADRHNASPAARRFGAVGLLTVYVVLLFAVPSNIVIAGMGSLGRPAQLWGALLLMIWAATKLQTTGETVVRPSQPIKVALALLVAVALVSFAAAMLRGQPYDQVSPATTAIIRLLSWCGPLLVAIDGIHTRNEISTILRRIVIGASCLACLGIAQFVTSQTLLDWWVSIPGVQFEGGGLESRGVFTRASGTAVHPLEYTATMAGCLPLAVVTAVAGGFRPTAPHRWIWWVPPALLLTVSALAVSRSATIGLVVAVVASLPSLPKVYRWVVAVGALGVVAVLVAAVPGLFSTVLYLFASAGEDSSTQSRSDALSRLGDFVSPSPFIGAGFGTFTSRYYIFDNQWVITLIDIGIIGLFAMLFLVGAAFRSAATAGQQSEYVEAQQLGRSIAAAVLTVAVLFLFFDGFAFAIAVGFLFLLLGLAGAARNVGSAGGEEVARSRNGAASMPRQDEEHGNVVAARGRASAAGDPPNTPDTSYLPRPATSQLDHE